MGAWSLAARQEARHSIRIDLTCFPFCARAKKVAAPKGTATLVLGNSEPFVQKRSACLVLNMGRLFKKCYKRLRIHSLTGGP
jgi:hypothetical protein